MLGLAPLCLHSDWLKNSMVFCNCARAGYNEVGVKITSGRCVSCARYVVNCHSCGIVNFR